MTLKSRLAPGFRYAGVTAILFLFALISMTGSAQVAENSGVTIKNFGKINDNYYRGTQPTQEEFAQLKRFGIKTIIDLRKDSIKQEPDWVRATGMQYFNIPLTASRTVTEEQTSYFLSLVNDPANVPVYVHCKAGRHRTGEMTAIYRITHDGWTADQAYKEMEKYDYNGGFFGGPPTPKNFVYSFYDRYSARNGQKGK